MLESARQVRPGFKRGEIPEESLAVLREVFASVEKSSGGSIKIEPVEDDKYVAIELAHRGRQGESVYLDLDSESAGTRRLLIVLSLAY